LTAHFIKEDAPEESGIYALCDAEKWIYIGETGNLKQALLAHLDPGMNPDVDRAIPKTFSYELCPAEQRMTRWTELVEELHPIVTKRAAQNA
jgi:hypothetical protein